jgi:hypothetical protein
MGIASFCAGTYFVSPPEGSGGTKDKMDSRIQLLKKDIVLHQIAINIGFSLNFSMPLLSFAFQKFKINNKP